MYNLLNILELFLGSLYFLFAVTTASLILKFFILGVLVRRGSQVTEKSYPWIFLVSILVGTLISDVAWIVKLIQSLFVPNLDYRFIVFLIRIAWGFTIVQYHGFTLFLESLVTQQYKLPIRQKIFLSFSSLLFLFFIGLAFFDINCVNPVNKHWIEFKMQGLTSLYVLFPLILISLFITIRNLQNTQLPRIIKKQFKLLLQVVIAPYWVSDILQIYPFNFSPTLITNSYAFTSISNILLTLAIYFCARKIMGLRFLNLENHVQITPTTRFSFMDSFKNALEQLGYVKTLQELRHITQSFFKENFAVPLGKTTLHIRALDQTTSTDASYDLATGCVETFFASQDKIMLDHIAHQKILIYDEVAFNNFYENNIIGNTLIKFLDTLNADIFLPIYEKNSLIAYVIVERFARFDQFYSSVERDEMLVFGSYLNNIINLLQNKSLETLSKQSKELQEEIYRKHLEINQYKESIRSFLRNKKQQNIGIIFYKQRKFTFGNQTAKELIQININVQIGHPISKALKNIAQSVENYKSPQTMLIKDIQGKQLVLSAVPHLEHEQVIIMVHYPEVSDVLKKQFDVLQDPSEWDYVLYLETTESGKLINQLIPGSGPLLLKFKIELLKTAFSKKALLLDLPEKDLVATAELLHHLSLRDNIYTLDLQQPVKNSDVAIQLFGINPIFGIKSNEPLLVTLDRSGTLFIKNIEYLDLDTQEYLAEFIRYGFFRTFKSDQKITSDVRIICSTRVDLQTLVHEHKFSKALFNELTQTKLSMPSLMTLPEDELKNLADGFSEQAIRTSDTFKSILTLSERDKDKLMHLRPASLQELREKVQHTLVKKSVKNNIYEEAEFDPAYQVTEPELAQIARLGKQVLKDRKMMTLLWNKFKSQNKIATFLGVNRSSINRRCKEYNLE